jgi:hypothetical protein
MTARGYFLNIMALSSLFSSYGDLYNSFLPLKAGWAPFCSFHVAFSPMDESVDQVWGRKVKIVVSLSNSKRS